MKNACDDIDVPAFVGPHEGRELALMQAGKKHLSKFVHERSSPSMFPEKEFDLLVAEGSMVKHQRFETIFGPDDEDVQLRTVLYATVAEDWRIPAMNLVLDIYTGLPGWRPDFERIIGSLLGYDSRDVELFIERLYASGKIDRL